jgi:hypothetical protein
MFRQKYFKNHNIGPWIAQSPSHVECSESFYKGWIEADLATRSSGDRETMKKTYDMLLRVQNQEELEEVWPLPYLYSISFNC